MVKFMYSSYNEFLNNNLETTGYEPQGESVLFALYDSHNDTIRGNTFVSNSNNPNSGAPRAILIRDTSSYNIFENNTITANHTVEFHLGSVGTTVYPHNNTFRNNVISGSTYTIMFWGAAFDNVFDRNTIIARGNAGESFGVGLYAPEVANTFTNNTFVATGAGAVPFFVQYNTPVVLRNNIFYTAQGYALRLEGYGYPEPTPVSIDLLNSDYNLFYRQDGGAVIRDPGGFFISLAQFQSIYGKDLNSLEDNPLFVDLGQNNFNLRLFKKLKGWSFLRLFLCWQRELG